MTGAVGLGDLPGVAGLARAGGLATGHGFHRVGQSVEYRRCLFVADREGWEQPNNAGVTAAEFHDEAAP
jgi:hypothetical protein